MKRDKTVVGCTACSEEHRHFLHHVRHRSTFHRLCTSCVLKLHPGSFCPHCLDVFFDGSPPSDTIKCSKCTSIAHSSCIRPETAAASSSSYICPTCSNPSFSFFDTDGPSKRSRAVDGEPKRAIDLKLAKALLAAARIAAVSMSKAATAKRLEAERKVMEAASARKRAREALERAALVALKEKEKGVLDTVEQQKKKSKGNSAVAAAALPTQKRIQSHKLGGLPLSNAGVRDKEKWGGFQTSAVVVQRTPKNGVAAKENEAAAGGSPSSVLGRQNHAVDKEKEKIRAFSGPSVAGQKHSQNSSCLLEEEKGNSKGFTDSDSSLQKPPLPNEDAASVSMANPGGVFTGSQNTLSSIL